MKKEQVVFNRANSRIFSFIERPICELEPQAQCILNVIQEHGPVNRFELIKLLAGVLETKSTISKVLSYHQRLLVRLNCIRVESPGQHRQRLELEKLRDRIKAKVVSSGMGGYSLQIGDERPVGHYPTVADVIRVAELNHYEIIQDWEDKAKEYNAV